MDKIICNPMNLEYRYQIKKSPVVNAVFREAADPTMVLFKDVYYLFISMTGGFWYSDDLHSWKFKETPELPIYDYAPDVREVDGAVIFSASRREENCSFYRSENPLEETFEEISSAFPFWDPNVFQDDDGRLYFYWGCSNNEPIWGIEMDPATFKPIGEKQAMLAENEGVHGWERNGDNNVMAEPKSEMERLIRQHVGTKPYIEGAFVNKHKGRYYLQYAGPGTQYNVYSDGVYVSNNPLGPYEYQKHNPFSSKPGGFMTGAGHGSTFQDKDGNWWHVSTMQISVNENFERRVALFPCDFDNDGIMWCNQNFADYPFALPKGKRQEKEMTGTSPMWMLLSYGAKASASSSRPGYEAEKGVNEDTRTWWAAENTGRDQWYKIDLAHVYGINALQLNFADHMLPLPDIKDEDMHAESFGARKIVVESQITAYLLEGSADGEAWECIKDARADKKDYSHDFILLPEEKKYRYLRVSEMEMAMGGVPAISGLRVFGKGGKNPPAPVNNVNSSRENRLNILLSWAPSADADGYNVRYGIDENKLYSSWQLYGKNSLDLSMVNGDTSYYIAVDAFNKNGVSPGKVFFVE